MHDFKYKGRDLYCEDVRVSDVAKKAGTPLYLYSSKTFLGHYLKLKRAFKAVSPLICFSMKSNASLALCRLLVKNGAGLDIVSGGELFKALKVKCPPKRIVYAGVGKTQEEIRYAIKSGILFFNAESTSELKAINNIACGLRKVAAVCLRLNPDIDAHTHKYITTAKSENKFGIDFKTAKKIFLRRKDFRNLKISGVHMHIGSQIVEASAFVKALKKVLLFIDDLAGAGVDIEYLNIGGGLGIIYSNEAPQTADEFAAKVIALLKNRPLKIIMEPGRFISGNSGILVSRVVYVKDTPKKHFVIMDSGMNDLIRPSLYGAYHKILPVRRTKDEGRGTTKYDIVGPICESGDFFAKDRRMPLVKEGDLLAIMSSGAYASTMSSNYNARPRIAEAVVKDNKFFVTRKRESYQDLIRNEIIPTALR